MTFSQLDYNWQLQIKLKWKACDLCQNGWMHWAGYWSGRRPASPTLCCDRIWVCAK